MPAVTQLDNVKFITTATTLNTTVGLSVDTAIPGFDSPSVAAAAAGVSTPDGTLFGIRIESGGESALAAATYTNAIGGGHPAPAYITPLFFLRNGIGSTLSGTATVAIVPLAVNGDIARSLDIQVFNYTGSAQTWAKPPGAKMVRVWLASGASSGVPGIAAASGTASQGGWGGGYNPIFDLTFDAALIGATATITVGAGGAAVAGRSDGTRAAANGGGASSFVSGSLSMVGGSIAAGVAGNAFGGSSPGQVVTGTVSNISYFAGGQGGAGGTGSFGSGGPAGLHAGGGGGGGGVSATPAAFVGGAGGMGTFLTLLGLTPPLQGASSTTGNGGNGGNGPNPSGVLTGGVAGSGGGSTTFATGNGGNGGNGGIAAGGGGGGCCLAGNTAGSGGAGGNGRVVVVTTF